jgi:hypothetical protein
MQPTSFAQQTNYKQKAAIIAIINNHSIHHHHHVVGLDEIHQELSTRLARMVS